ncbi:MAG: ChrR family anti-sigma-E factor [Roseovarius sp.]|nr:ChrR family anti-sigma-E factor [Roseovarius sp.]MCY4316674.1 ChrR family anti-sigma-E factor [Roseovarius sp.]
MSVEHHVGGDLLLAYGAGSLDEATSLLVATHLALCPASRQELGLVEEVFGVMLGSIPVDAELDESMLDAMISSPRLALAIPATSGSFVLPQPLRDRAGGDVGDLNWRALGGGIRQVPLRTNDTATRARLLSIPAGRSVPDHGHGGFEATLVLAGTFYDREKWYRRGDVAFADPNVVHQPVAGPEADCICLAVTDAPLRFRSLVPRLLQPLFGL